MWRTVALRGAGFPASMVLSLAADAASAAADRVATADRELIHRRQEALDHLASCPTTDIDDHRKRRARRRKLKKDRIPADSHTAEEAALASAVAARNLAREQLRAVYDRDRARIHDHLLRTLADPRFQEAAIWQNAAAVRVISRQAAAGTRRGTPLRLELVAKLVQRYALKNDSIGFFGPVGWATITDRPVAIEAPPPLVPLARREVYFEDWCIDAVAARFAADPRIKPWTAPRVKAGVWLGPDGVYVPVVGRVCVTTAERRVLMACDGFAPARTISGSLVAGPQAIALSRDEVYAILDRLVGAGIVEWRFEVAPQLHPDRELADHIARIDDPELRRECDEALSALRDGRARVALCAGQPEALASAIHDLNTAFERVTGCSPTRRPGQTYAARTLVYEDCVRAGEIEIGAALMARLGPPLTIVLEATRWAAAQVAGEARRSLRQCHAEMGQGPEVDGQLFFDRVSSKVWRAHADAVRQPFQDRWRSVLELREGDTRVFRPYAVTADRAREAFAATGTTWSRADWVSPDIMVAAAGLDALRRGEFHCVLGEVHASNTIVTSALFAQHPDPDQVLTAMAADAGRDLRVFVQMAKAHVQSRTRILGVPPAFSRFEWGDEPPSLPRYRPLPAGRFVAILDGDRVRMRSRDGNVSFDALELFGPQLSGVVNRLLGDFLPSARRTPRVTVGDLTIARERWRIPKFEMRFLEERDHVLQFAALRAWARNEGMPRHMFFLAPGERKPCYLDFDSPLYVDVFVRLLARAEPTDVVRMVEMLPQIGDTWLTDASGMRYTSELRFVAHQIDAGGTERDAMPC